MPCRAAIAPHRIPLTSEREAALACRLRLRGLTPHDRKEHGRADATRPIRTTKARPTSWSTGLLWLKSLTDCVGSARQDDESPADRVVDRAFVH